jgi:translation initiation factor 2B subunit (eIF-2B alpha/beta/delta family)
MGFWMKDKKDETQVVKSAPTKLKTDLLDSKFPGSIKSTEFSQTIGTPASDGVSQPEIVDYFKKVFTENNIPGPDYQEFKNALEEMKSQPLDEATKIKTVWISFKAMGLTPQKLIDTAGQYKTLFATKLSQFDGELQRAVNEHVDIKQKEVETLIAKNKQIDEDMKKLNAQSLANADAVKVLNDEIQKNASELSNKKNNWHKVYDDFIKEIDGHVELINKYLLEKLTKNN